MPKKVTMQFSGQAQGDKKLWPRRGLEDYITDFNPLTGTLKPQSSGYGDWYTGRLSGGLLHLVQRGRAWVGCGPDQAQPDKAYRCTNFVLFDAAL